MSLSPAQRQLEKQVNRRDPHVLAGLPGERKRHILEMLEALQLRQPEAQLIQTQITASSSPVPPAELLAGYNQAFENGAERLFALVEKQSDHRQKIEEKAISGQIRANARGQWFALILALLFGGMAVYLGATGHDVLAGGVFTTTIGGLVWTFLTGQKSQQRNLDKKAPR